MSAQGCREHAAPRSVGLCLALAALLGVASCAPDARTPSPVKAGRTGGLEWSAAPKVTSRRLNAVSLRGPARGYAVGDGGVVLATTDAGKTWKRQNSGTRTDLLGVAFPSTMQGYAVGKKGTILSTRNGGGTWNQQPSGVTSDLLSVSFPTSRTGYASGRDGVLLTTSDGGRTWTKRTLAPDFGYPYDLIFSRLQFLDAQRGYMLGRHTRVLLWTADGGRTFESRTTGSITPHAVSFIDSSRGFLAGDQGDVLATSNGGRTWSARRCCREGESLRDIAFSTPGRGLVAGTVLDRTPGGEQQRSLLMSTVDGGRRWRSVRSGVTQVLTDVEWRSQMAVAVGHSGVVLVGRSRETPAR